MIEIPDDLFDPVDEDEEPVRFDPEGDQAQVSREIRNCDFCKGENVHTIRAYDDRIYKGWACSRCVLGRKAAPSLPLDDPLLRPMIFVARALRGDEPYKSLLKTADEQKRNPELAVERAKAIKKEKRLRARGLLPPVPRSPKNRRERRIVAAQNRKAKAKAAKVEAATDGKGAAV